MADNNFDTYKTTGSFNLGNQITLKNVNSNVDRDYGPYKDKTLAEIADLLKDTIQIGKTVGVIEENKIVEYWWQNTGTKNEFVKKQVPENNMSPISNTEIDDLFKDTTL